MSDEVRQPHLEFPCSFVAEVHVQEKLLLNQDPKPQIYCQSKKLPVHNLKVNLQCDDSHEHDLLLMLSTVLLNMKKIDFPCCTFQFICTLNAKMTHFSACLFLKKEDCNI